MSKNLLTALHRWASRQDENFITDAFAHLLQSLIERDRRFALNFLGYLTEERFPVLKEGDPVQVSTQVTVAVGRPDIEISCANHLVYVEAKVEAGFGENQLERYLADLEQQSPKSSTLVVLSRYPLDIPVDIRARVVTRRWYQVAHWLHLRLGEGVIKDPVNIYLAAQLIEFFEARNILMEKVEPTLITGIRSFRSLIAMVSEAIAARKVTMHKSFARDWAGYYFSKEKREFFVGLYYERPQFLVFETVDFAVVPDAAKALGFGKMLGSRWEWLLPLDSEEGNFFSVSREEQMECVGRFIDEGVIAANKVRKVEA